LKAENGADRSDVTSGGRLFHVFAAAMGKARLPMVRSRVGGTVNSHHRKVELTTATIASVVF